MLVYDCKVLGMWRDSNHSHKVWKHSSSRKIGSSPMKFAYPHWRGSDDATRSWHACQGSIYSLVIHDSTNVCYATFVVDEPWRIQNLARAFCVRIAHVHDSARCICIAMQINSFLEAVTKRAIGHEAVIVRNMNEYTATEGNEDVTEGASKSLLQTIMISCKRIVLIFRCPQKTLHR